MSQERYPLIFIKNANENLRYSSPQRGGPRHFPTRNRASHSQRLTERLNNIWRNFQNVRTEREAVSLTTREGQYLEFKSSAGYDLVIKSLEDIRQGIRLSTVREDEENGEKIQIATVYIPKGKEGFFLKKIQDYLDPEKNTIKGNPKNNNLIRSIEDIKTAILESFWQDAYDLIPNDAPEWCEVWLRSENDNDILDLFTSACGKLNIDVEEGVIKFPERIVVLIKANRDQLTELLKVTDYLGEIRKAKETVKFFIDLSNVEQAEWVEDLRSRILLNEEPNTSICILDTGVNNGHRLIEPMLKNSDMHSYNPDWGINDHKGHGTRMSGIALFGNIAQKLQDNSEIHIDHVLESGKILPPVGTNDPRLYGYITQQVVSLVEIEAPERKRIICLAVTTNGDDRGRPSSWSGSIDALASGADDNVRRLIVISAGNVAAEWETYPDINIASSIHSPSQSWNALSVGAYTNLVQINNPNLANFDTVAPPNGLSPFSSTSIVWEEKKWPIKPDVLFEGGNVAVDENGFTTTCDDLSVLTTHHQPTVAQFDSFSMTSAATAKASWMAAKIQAEYPDMWPETVRGLMIHSANWTQTMKDQFFHGGTERAKYENLLKTCGYGIPDLDKALYCGKNSLTLIAEEKIQPFDKREDSSGYRTKDMHFYAIPWPKETLLELGETPVRMRVTLSYFIEPGPGEIGWKDKYRYRSHGLKFDVNNISETKNQFVVRVNKAARVDEGQAETSNDSSRWKVGSQNRNLGSVHSDIIEGTAAELATCNFIGVFPVIGWWRERTHLGKWSKESRYSLIVSIETPSQDVDLYTPVAVKLEIPIEV